MMGARRVLCSSIIPRARARRALCGVPSPQPGPRLRRPCGSARRRATSQNALSAGTARRGQGVPFRIFEDKLHADSAEIVLTYSLRGRSRP
jgi:hypothetical protein